MKEEEALNPTPINQQLDYLTEAVLGGHINPIEAVGAIKLFNKALETANKAIKDAAMVELAKYPEGFENETVKVELRNSATRYKYDHIPEWQTLKDQLKDIEDSAKQAEKMSQRMQKLVTDEGEVVTPAIASGGGETIFIKLKK